MKFTSWTLASASLLAVAAPAFAQEQASEPAAGSGAARDELPPSKLAEEDSEDPNTIVVTGTLIQGVAPVGSNVISVSEKNITEIGAPTASELLRRIPQLGDFNALPQPTSNGVIPYSPLSLRGVGALSGMATLILLDGKRIVPTGIGQNWIDTQMIPAGVIERVEVIADGGSSIYGSDAISGVINFVTRRRKDGITATAQYGIAAGDFDSYNVTVTGGTSWAGGSLVLSLNHAHQGTLLGRDLDYLIENKTPIGGVDSRALNCDPGTITASGVLYALPNRTLGRNFCSAFDQLSFYPEETRSGAFATFSQDILPGLEFELNAFVSRRTTSLSDPDNARTSGTITRANPYFVPIGTETSQAVAFSYENIFGINRNPSVFEAWQVTPSLTWDITPNWTARFNLNYGRSNVVARDNGFNATAQGTALACVPVTIAACGLTFANALNPYNLASTNPTVLAQIRDFQSVQRGRQELQEARLVLDGTLFELPAGPLKLALGAEARQEFATTSTSQGPAAAQVLAAPVSIDRTVYSVFGEVFIPVFDSLDLSLSARHDDYDDVGSTTNPKVGATFEPTDWITVRGSWGSSFHAPALADLSAPLGFGVIPVTPFPFRPPGIPLNITGPAVILGGAVPGIRPESATTWSVGTELRPVNDLRLGLTYWNIDYRDRVDQNAGFFLGGTYYTDPVNAPFFLIRPASPQAIIDQFGNFPVIGGLPNLQAVFNTFGQPLIVTDQRKQNLGTLKMDGLDFSVNYAMDLTGGKLSLGVNGTYLLNRDRQTLAGTPFSETLEFGDNNAATSRLSATTTAGWSMDRFSFLATVYYRGKARVAAQRIDSHTTLSLFTKYDLTKNISATVNIDNAFDSAPPVRSTVTNGVAFIDPGRIIKFGITARY